MKNPRINGTFYAREIVERIGWQVLIAILAVQPANELLADTKYCALGKETVMAL